MFQRANKPSHATVPLNYVWVRPEVVVGRLEDNHNVDLLDAALVFELHVHLGEPLTLHTFPPRPCAATVTESPAIKNVLS